ncbi:hypothetical protein RB653_009740 [Dictyostelium firmibasis]|uniref:Glucosidase 2 subunit beta n=1 Tax=Dictyostelium firmibasis TaxID=79012 RepID=A0AAN7TJ25_9MYCE
MMKLILYFCLAIACLAQQVLSLSPTYGVGPEELEYYKEAKYFNCLRSNVQIPFSQVNDDFCDCPDGTDEPGTSACSSIGRFYCQNSGHKGDFIYSSFVNDGVCDCCDGSDEYQLKIKCKNNCKEIGEESRKKQNQAIEAYENGLQKKKQMEEEGTRVFNEKTEEITRLRKEIDPITQEIKELEVLVEQKKSEREVENKRLLDEKENKDKETADSKPNVDEQQKETEENKEVVGEGVEQPEIQTSELLDAISKGKDDINNNNNDNNNEDEDEDDNSTNSQDKIGRTTIVDQNNDFLNEDNNEDLDQFQKILKSFKSVKNSIYNFILPILPNRFVSLKDMDLGGLESELSKKRESLKEKENEIEKIDKMLKSDLGVNNVFLPLYNKCFDLTTKEYTYTVCPYEKASQGHTSLGKFESFNNNGKTMSFENGQQCWGGPKRSLKVNMECGGDNELYDVQEPGKCEYTIKFKTPALCSEEHLKVLKLESDHSL